MVKPKDEFWKFAEATKKGFKCNFCGREFSGGAARIKSHLSGVKGRDVDICTKVPQEVQEAARQAISAKRKTPPSDLEDNGTSHHVCLSGSNSCVKMSEGVHGKDKSLVDEKLTRFLVSNNIAVNAVEGKSFIDFVRSVAEFGPGYELPSCPTLETKFIPGFAVEVEQYVKGVKESWALTGCTLMVDICCDNKEQATMNVFAYSPGGAVFINSFDISKLQKTDVHLTGIVSIIEDIGPHHVVQLITSKATIFDSVGDILESNYPQICKTRCVACEIQSLLKDIFDKSQWVNEVIDDAKSIFKYMNEDTSILSLEHPFMIKFASTYKMLQSIFDNENELQSADLRAPDDSKKEIVEKIKNFWSRRRDVLLVLKSIVQVLCLVEGDGSTLGYLYEAMERAEAAIKQGCGGDTLTYAPLLELFEKRQERLIHPIHVAAAFLNPAYMWSENFKEDQKMKDGLNFMASKLVAGEEKITFLREMELYRRKDPKLFTETAIVALKAHHPRVWWDRHGDHLPVLRKYAIRILSQPCNSSCEQRWGAFEVAQTKKMNRQTVKMSDNFVHVRMNTMIKEKFNTLDKRFLEPIDLKKCNELPNCVDLEQRWKDDSAELINEIFDNNVMEECSDPGAEPSELNVEEGGVGVHRPADGLDYLSQMEWEDLLNNGPMPTHISTSVRPMCKLMVYEETWTTWQGRLYYLLVKFRRGCRRWIGRMGACLECTR